MHRFHRGFFFVGLFVAVGCAGCATFSRYTNPQANMETLSESALEHQHRVAAIHAHDRRALAEDLDLLFMTERQGRLTRWHDR